MRSARAPDLSLTPMQTSRLSAAIERYWINGAILGLLALLYAPLVLHWYVGWLRKTISIEHEYFSHGLIGLPFAAYLAWLNRKRWQRLEPPRHQRLNLAQIAGGGLLLVSGIFYLTGLPDPVNLSLPLLLYGLVLWLKGRPGFQLQWFPLLLVLLATPNEVPYLLTPYTLPLQSFIAGTAGFILNQLGMAVTVRQIYLEVGGRLVEVAPYCAGLKMLFTSLYVALMLLHWTDNLRSRTVTTLVLLSTVALSVTGNIIRNSLLTFFHGTGQDGAFQWLHDGWGGDIYSAITLALLIPLLNQIEKVFASLDHPKITEKSPASE
jgi:cyanoexosortase B